METLSWRQATEADVPFLLDLRRATMDVHLAASGIPASEAEHLRRVHAAFHSAAILLNAGTPIGMLKVVREGPRWELMQFQLLPSVQGKGIGTSLLRSLIAEARASGASLRLTVLKANPAKRLYERLGFQVVAEKEHAYAMELGA